MAETNKLTRFGCLLIIVLLSSCATKLQANPPAPLQNCLTVKKCITPCKIKLKRNENVTIIFSKKGYYSEILTVGPEIPVSGVVVSGLSGYGMLVDT